MGTKGKTISLRVESLPNILGKVVKQIETSAFLIPSCGGPAPTAK